MMRAYCAEGDLLFRDDRQPKALKLLAAGEPLAKAWLIDVEGVAVDYVIITLSFSVGTSARDGFIDELFI